MTYKGMIADKDFLEAGEAYYTFGDTPDAVYSEMEAFWKNFEIVTGAAVPAADRESLVLSCLC